MAPGSLPLSALERSSDGDDLGLYRRGPDGALRAHWPHGPWLAPHRRASACAREADHAKLASSPHRHLRPCPPRRGQRRQRPGGREQRRTGRSRRRLRHPGVPRRGACSRLASRRGVSGSRTRPRSPCTSGWPATRASVARSPYTRHLAASTASPGGPGHRSRPRPGRLRRSSTKAAHWLCEASRVARPQGPQRAAHARLQRRGRLRGHDRLPAHRLEPGALRLHRR